MLTRINQFSALNIFDELDDWTGIKKFWSPEIDVTEDDNNIILEADVPGLDKDNVELDLKDNVLTLKGTKEIKREKEGKKFHRYERSTGSFSRSFVLPDNIKKEEIQAEFDKGVLKITVPKTQKEVPKSIKINFK